MLKKLARAVVCLLPMCAKKRMFLNALGYDIALDAVMSPCVVWNVDRFRLRSGGAIAAGTTFRNLRSVDLQEHSIVGAWNRIVASSAAGFHDCARSFEVGQHSAVTSRHFIEATGGVTVGAYSGLGGVRAAVLTIGTSSSPTESDVQPVAIGSYCLLNTGCTLLPGSVIEDRVVVGARTVVSGTLSSDGLYISPRARRAAREER